MLLALRNTLSHAAVDGAVAVSQVAQCLPQVAGGMITSGELGIHTAKALCLEGEPLWL